MFLSLLFICYSVVISLLFANEWLGHSIILTCDACDRLLCIIWENLWLLLTRNLSSNLVFSCVSIKIKTAKTWCDKFSDIWNRNAPNDNKFNEEDGCVPHCCVVFSFNETEENKDILMLHSLSLVSMALTALLTWSLILKSISQCYRSISQQRLLPSATGCIRHSQFLISVRHF